MKPTTDIIPAPSLQPPASSLQPNPGWESVHYFADLAAKFEHCKLACQVMAGFELVALHKAIGMRPGKRTDIATVANLPNRSGGSAVPLAAPPVKKSWPALVKQHAGISDDTARNWMAMAKSCSPRLKKLKGFDRLRELVSVPPTQWSAPDRDLMFTALRKITDGHTQLEFMEALGTCKKPQGSGANGNPKGKPAGTPDLDTQIAQTRDQAVSDWDRAAKTLEASFDNFTLLHDHEITVQVAVLEAHLKARRAWLNTPKLTRHTALDTIRATLNGLGVPSPSPARAIIQPQASSLQPQA